MYISLLKIEFIMKKSILLFLLITLFVNSLEAQNLITNGDFETSGGFTSNYNL